MADSPTIVVARLDDQELQKSIKSMVDTFNESLNGMKTHADSVVEAINASLKGIKGGSVSSGGVSDGGSTKRARATNEETAAVEKNVAAREKQIKTIEKSMTLDQGSVAIRMASGSFRNAETLDTMRTNLELLKIQLREAHSHFSAFVKMARDASTTGDKGYFQFATGNVHKYEGEVKSLISQIRSLQNGIKQMGTVIEPQGHSIQNYVKSLQQVSPELRKLAEQYKNGTSLLQTLSSSQIHEILAQRQSAQAAETTSQSYQHAAQSAKEYSDQVKQLAAEVRASDRWKREDALGFRRGAISLDGRSIAVSENLEMGVALEEQIEQAIKHVNDERQRGVQITQQQTQAIQQMSEADQKAAEALGWTDKKRTYIKPQMTVEEYTPIRAAMEQITGLQSKWVDEIDKSKASYNELSSYLKELKGVYADIWRDPKNATAAKNIAHEIQTVEREMQKLQQTMSRPVSWEAVDSLPTNTLDDIAYKMRQMQLYKSGLDLKEQSSEIGRVNNAYDSLRRAQLKYMSDAQKLTGINAALGRSWNYMKNRLAYYFTVTTSVSLVKQVAEIRGQYELMERSIGILVNDMSRGTDIFNKLNDMALKSPFTMLELGSAAKQLVAFNIAADDVVDTTRRLADMAAAVGLPIERLTYALGQVKAYGYLNSRDARIFLNAGIPIVQMLTDMYNRQRDVDDELVTASQVRDMMTKRMISYADVMKVVNEATDAGGRFFNFQERAAETLKVKIANLSLAWNNMLNDVGASNQGFMSGGLRVVTSMLKHWREFSRVLESLIVTIGVYKTVASMVAVQNDRMVTTGMLASLQNWVVGIKKASGAMATLNAVMGHNPVLFGATLITALTSYFLFFRDTVGDAGRKVKELNDSIEGVSKQMSELYVKAMTTDNLNSQIEDLRQMLDRIQSDFGITIPVNLEDVDEGNIKAKIQEVKSRIDSYLAFTETFGTAALENEKLGDSFEKFGTAATATFNNITNNLAVVKEGMLALGATADEVTLLDRQEGESTVEYLSRIISLYEQLQILRKSELENVYKTPMAGGLPVLSQDNMYDLEKMQSSALDALGVKNKAVFQNMLKDVQDYYSTLSLSKSAFNKFARELEKQLDINNILDVNERTLKVEAAIEKYSAQKGLTQTATELLKYLANQRYKTNIQVGVDPNAKKEVEQELKDWQIELQREADKQGIKLKVTFTEAQTEAGYAAEALKQVKDAEEELAVLRRKKAVGTATQEDIDEATRKLENLRKAAKLAGADLESLNKSKGGSKKDPVLDALKTEIKLVEQLQGEYDKLTKGGANSEEALNTIRGAFGNTIKQLNSQLRGYGLPELTTQLITGKDPNKALAHFKQTLQSLVDKGMMSLERSKEVEAIIEKLTISAKTYNLDKITKGLNSELDKLKEEYELAVALDTDPELGNVFASYFGIDTEKLPHDFEQVAKLAQERIGKVLQENHYEGTAIDVESLLDKKKFDQWVKDSGQELSSNLVKELEAFREYLHKTQVDEIKSQEESWQKLLEKYAEYEYKKSQIQKTAEEERKVAQAKGAGQDIIDAINNREQRELANLDFTEFQKTGTWAVATGDLAGMTNTALRGLIRSLEEYKAKSKNLDPKQIKQINRALKSLHSELRKNNPFGAMADAMEEARLRSNELDVDIQQTEAQIDRLIEKREKNNGLTEEEEKELADYRKQLKGLNKEQGALADVSLQTMVTEVTKVTSALSGATSMVGELAEAFGDTATAEVVKDVGTVLDKIGQGASIGSVGGGWGALAGAIVGLGAGLAQIFVGDRNQQITDAVEDVEEKVNDLESQYKALEYEVEKAYGVAQIGALKAAKANKDLQLVELKRQLTLEESRESKYRDEEKIASLKGEIIDLQHEINDMVEDFVNDMMGISSVGDAMENVVSAMIEAFKKGEDYMKEYDDNFSKMIDNMIAKSIASTLISDTIEKVAAKVKEAAYTRENRGGKEQQYAELINQIQAEESKLADWKGYVQGLVNEFNRWSGIADEEWIRESVRTIASHQMDVNALEAQIEAMRQQAEQLQRELSSEVTMTPEDINSVRDIAQNAKKGVQEQFEALMKAYGITFGQDAEGAKLSSLQAGIQGVTEETAGALEAYMNGVSQQCYLHSTLLTQIRDVMVTFDPEVSMGIQSQMLLQMQQSYQVQMSIESILQGVLNPSGRAFAVEIIS